MYDFDNPLFKILANNDTGAAAGHQGGIVIPKDLEDYFPILKGHTSSANPTVDTIIRAVLVIGSKHVGFVETRYQYQTWGGTRSPERRLTGNLGQLRNQATGGDLLLIERSLSDREFYRLTLIRKTSSAYKALQPMIAGRNWGPLDIKSQPVAETDISAALAEQQSRERKPFQLFDPGATMKEGRVKRIARSQAFSRQVLPLYSYQCAVCGLAHFNGSRSEAEAAHIVPRRLKGSDDARNGLALCRSHHWAFDQGLFGIRPTRQIVVHPAAAKNPLNAHLKAFDGKPLGKPASPALEPDVSALAWHLAQVVGL